MDDLNKYRKIIDKINNNILKLLSRRLEVSKKIGNYKKKRGMKIQNKKREKEIIKSLKEKAKQYKLDKEYIEEIFRLIMKNSRKAQK